MTLQSEYCLISGQKPEFFQKLAQGVGVQVCPPGSVNNNLHSSENDGGARI